MEKDYCDLLTTNRCRRPSPPQTLVTASARPASGGAFGPPPLGNVNSMGTRFDAPPRLTDFRDRHRPRLRPRTLILIPADLDHTAVRP